MPDAGVQLPIKPINLCPHTVGIISTASEDQGYAKWTLHKRPVCKKKERFLLHPHSVLLGRESESEPDGGILLNRNQRSHNTGLFQKNSGVLHNGDLWW